MRYSIDPARDPKDTVIIAVPEDEEQCVCGTGFTCMATEHDKGLACPDCGEYPCHPQCLSGGGL